MRRAAWTQCTCMRHETTWAPHACARCTTMRASCAMHGAASTLPHRWCGNVAALLTAACMAQPPAATVQHKNNNRQRCRRLRSSSSSSSNSINTSCLAACKCKDMTMASAATMTTAMTKTRTRRNVPRFLAAMQRRMGNNTQPSSARGPHGSSACWTPRRTLLNLQTTGLARARLLLRRRLPPLLLLLLLQQLFLAQLGGARRTRNVQSSGRALTLLQEQCWWRQPRLQQLALPGLTMAGALLLTA
mmetsp:Transcript_38293/g.113515  ORF Transcript_38293/g.113515 Transcript_38293/m.113515 type:complete len:246 (+) Transcript_38293:2779-3516(+)